MDPAIAPDGDGVTTMLDFYREHGISPVTQDVTDQPAHFQRRAFLYRELGLWPRSIKGKRVLEVGPGAGENALYTVSLGPKHVDFVEPNMGVHATLRQRFFHSIIFGVRLEDVPFMHPCDLVLCEGLLGLCGSNPNVLLEKLIECVAVGGVLVITCIDAISDHAEVLRRALAQRYINSSMSLQEKVDVLRPVFAPHLATLKGMTRSVDDWILDNLLNPASIGPTFSIPDALTALDGRFELLGCSPRFLMDWRWYKDAKPGLQWATDAYWAQAHNLLDYRRIDRERSRTENETLMFQCRRTRVEVAALERGEPIDVYTGAVEQDPGWFGRGQQYLSFVRVA